VNADEYLKLAAVEDQMWYFQSLHGHLGRELSGHLGTRAEVLDAGCGTGGLIRRLSAKQPQWGWAGVDLSSIALELARRRSGPEVDLREASVTALPWGDGRFDAVVSADVLYHVDDDAAALREFFRVLRPGGIVVLNLPAYPWLWSYHDEAVHSRRRYTRSGVLRALRTAGFTAGRATYWNTLPFPLIVARRKLWPAPKGGSDVQLMAPPIESVFQAMMGFEHRWIRHVSRLPFGSSVLAVATKPVETESALSGPGAEA
jgi:SAM-dependent methyltransferase